ncbi:MAG: UPF0280 family protein [Desulfotomaculales bacterium]
MLYSERAYRLRHQQEDLVHFRVVVKETDLDIAVKKERFSARVAETAKRAVEECRKPLEEYVRQDPEFLRALTPYKVRDDAPPIIKEMARAAEAAGVGPMAAVAGAIAEYVGRILLRYSRDVIIENGGDIYLRTGKIRRIGIFAGKSPFSYRLALEVKPEWGPLGVCTSSGTVGHSLSFGKADAVVVVSPSAALADAVATAAGNLVQTGADLQAAVEFALSIPGVKGAVAIKDELLAARGYVKLVPSL